MSNFKYELLEVMKQANDTAIQKGFWPTEGRNIGEQLALMHSELSECLEADRSGTGYEYCEKVPSITNFEEEMADLCIRVFDFCFMRGIKLPDAIEAKMAFNSGRPHKHGKKY